MMVYSACTYCHAACESTPGPHHTTVCLENFNCGKTKWRCADMGKYTPGLVDLVPKLS